MRGPGVEAGKILISSRLGKILITAEQEAKRLKDEYISVEHIILALLAEKGHTATSRIASHFNLNRAEFLKQLISVRGNQRVQGANPESTYEALSKYGRDLVEEARQDKLDPVVGRDSEIRRVIRILSRKTKNNSRTDRRTWGRYNSDR